MKLIRQREREREREREMSISGEEHVHRTLCEEDPGVFEDSGAANGAKVQLVRVMKSESVSCSVVSDCLQLQGL